MRSTLRVETPIVSASSRFCTVARIWRPNELYFSTALSAANAAEREHDREELAVRPLVAEHRDAARPASSAPSTGSPWAPKMSLRELLQDQGDTDGRQQRVERPFVHPLDDRRPRAAARGGRRRRRPPGARPTIEMPVLRDHLLGDVGDVGADHEELAVRHVDHAHLAERERQAERGQQQDGAGGGAGEEGGGECVHAFAFRASCGRGAGAGRGVPRRRTAPPTTGSELGRSGVTTCVRVPPGVALEERIGLDRARPSSTRCRTGCRR